MASISITHAGLNLRGVLEGEGDQLVILFHGFKGNIGYGSESLTYDLSQFLQGASYQTLRVNFAGCGDSDGRFEDMTVLGQVGEAISIIQYALENIKPSKLHLVGHSQGGVVASMVAPAFRDKIASLTLIAPAATLKDDALKGDCQGTSYDPNHIPERVEVDGFQVGGSYFRVAQYLPIYEMAEHYSGPVQLIHGLDDTVVDKIASERYADIYQNAQLNLIPEANHGLTGPGNQRADVKEKVLAFLNEN